MYAAYGTLILIYVMIGSTILSMGLWLMSYNIMWIFMVVETCRALLSIKRIKSCILLVTYAIFIYKDAQSHEHKKKI